MSKRSLLKTFVLAGGMALALGTAARAEDATVVELSQTACQFLESEQGVDHGYKSRTKADCETINGQSGEERLAKAKTLELKPGKYIFRVTNRDVSYPLGFWVRGEGLIGRATLPSVSGGGLTTGTTKDYAITLKAGEYLYSCPLNPTPDYRIVVKG